MGAAGRGMGWEGARIAPVVVPWRARILRTCLLRARAPVAARVTHASGGLRMLWGMGAR